jgi:hypothetical protein
MEEVRSGPFAHMPAAGGHYDVGHETLPYIRACLKETLRMKVVAARIAAVAGSSDWEQ